MAKSKEAACRMTPLLFLSITAAWGCMSQNKVTSYLWLETDGDRATSFQGQKKKFDEAQIKRLIRDINYNIDPLHFESTPAVHELIDIGFDAIPLLLEAMMDHQEVTRYHAQTALEGITRIYFGFVYARGWTVAGGQEKWSKLWDDLGNLSYKKTDAERVESIRLWRAWFNCLNTTDKHR